MRTSWRKYIRRARRIVYWIALLAIVAIISSRIDLARLARTIQSVNPILVVAGLLCFPLVIVIAGLRWKYTLNVCLEAPPSGWHAIRGYWTALAVGFFAPGSAGVDLFRVLSIGRRCRKYVHAAAVILLEKLGALVVSMGMVIVLYPPAARLVVKGRETVDQVYLVAAGGLVIVMVTVLVERLLHRAGLSVPIQKWLLRQAAAMGARARRHSAEAGAPALNTEMIDGGGFFRSRRALFGVIGLSLAIQFLTAVANQLLFRAAGYSVPFIVNLFLVPLFSLAFVLPISVRGVGVREGLYVFGYGLFGVPAETALVVSFLNLLGILLNQAIGCGVAWTAHVQPVVSGAIAGHVAEDVSA